LDGSLKQIKRPSNSRITSCQQQERLVQQRQLAWHRQQERLVQQALQQVLERQQVLVQLVQVLLLFYRKRPKQQQQ
jgi:hypothetical protein